MTSCSSFYFLGTSHVIYYFDENFAFLMFQITEKCLPAILQLPYLEDLSLPECIGVDALSQGCTSLEVHINDLDKTNSESFTDVSRLKMSYQLIARLILRMLTVDISCT